MKRLVIVVCICLAFFVRFYNFSNRVTYGPEQARSLLTATRNITDRFSLLGQEYFRNSSDGHRIYYSALFTYSLIPLVILFKGNPIPITAYFALLNLFTGYIIYRFSKKYINEETALVSCFLFVFSARMIYHSLFLWPYNYLPLLAISSLFIIYSYFEKRKTFLIFLLGVLSGMGFGIQYLYAVLVVVIFCWVFIRSKKRLSISSTFIFGFLLGIWPFVLFDLRHNFYTFNTIFTYLFDTVRGESDAGIFYYYFLPIWPYAAVLGGLIIYQIYKRQKGIAVSLLIIYLFFNLNSKLINYHEPTGMPKNLDWFKIQEAASAIAKDNPKDYNVVSLLDFDARGYILRYPLEFLFKTKPMGEEEYKNPKVLYVLSEDSYDFNSPKLWELSVFAPYTITTLKKIDPNYNLFKLEKR